MQCVHRAPSGIERVKAESRGIAWSVHALSARARGIVRVLSKVRASCQGTRVQAKAEAVLGLKPDRLAQARSQ
eukprot:6012727-Alexandrium_andersonii.AAC.1